MAAKRFGIFVAALPFVLGCSRSDDDIVSNTAGMGGASGTTSHAGAGNIANGGNPGGAPAGGANAATSGDDTLVVPSGVTVLPLPGGTGDLDFVALTLREGPAGLEAYAALKNDGDMAACSAGLTLQLFDQNQQTLGSNIGGLLSQHLYRFTDGTNAAVACIGPGDVSMADIVFGPDLALADVGFVEYSSTYFALDVTPIDGFTVTELQSVASGAGTSFTGTFTNGFDMTVNTPSVVVFTVNGAGRPLALATAADADSLPTGATWEFQTSAVDTAGSAQVAYPTAALPH